MIRHHRLQNFSDMGAIAGCRTSAALVISCSSISVASDITHDTSYIPSDITGCKISAIWVIHDGKRTNVLNVRPSSVFI